MSISTFQEKLFKGGCGMAVLLLCAAVMLGGVFYTSCMYGNRTASETVPAGRIAVHVAGAAIDESRIDDATHAMLNRQSAQSPGSAPTPESIAQTNIQVLQELVESGAEIELLKKNNVQPDDATITRVANADLDQKIEMSRMQLSMQRQGKGAFTDADFDAEIKKQTGKTLAQLKTDAAANIKKQLADKDQRESLVRSLAKMLLVDADEKKHQVSDAELEGSYATNEYKRILIRPGSTGTEQPESRLMKAQIDIGKGVTFEQAIDKYSTEIPTVKKKLSDMTTFLSAREIQSDPHMKPLAGMKVGQVSPVVDLPEGKAIYKLVSIKGNLPPDFAKNKEKFRKEYVEQLANREVEDQITQLKANPTFLKFDSPAYKALYDFMNAQNSPPDPTGKTSLSKYQAVYAEAKKAAQGSSVFDTRIATLARYMAMTQIWNDPTTDKSKVRGDRIETLQALLKSTESFDLRIELVNLFLDQKMNKEASEQLIEAASNNTNFDNLGFQRFGQVRDLLQKMVAQKAITPEDQKSVSDAQLEWSRQRVEMDKEKEEAMKQRAADDAALKAANDKAKLGAIKAEIKPPTPTLGKTVAPPEPASSLGSSKTPPATKVPATAGAGKK